MDNCEVLDCFDKLVGVKGCHNENCKLWVNDLPGISNELLDKISDNETETYFGVFTKAKKAAINTLKDDILEVLLRDQKRMRFGSTIFNSEQPRIIRPIVTTAVDKKYLGVLLTTAKSKYILANFNSLSFYSTFKTSVRASIFDYESNKTIWQADEFVEVKANELTQIDFNYSINSDKHRAVAAVLELCNHAEFGELSCNRFESEEYICGCDVDPCDSVCGDGTASYNKTPFESILSDRVDEFALYPFISDDLSDFESYEIVSAIVCADLEIVCSIEQFICGNAKMIARALVYLIGANILDEKLGGYRLNVFSKSNLEFTREKRDQFRIDYFKRLEKIAPNLPLSGDSLCWTCDKKVGAWNDSMV